MRLPTISVCLALEKKKKGRQEQFAEREAAEQEMPFWIQSRVFDPEPSLGRSVSDQPSRPPVPTRCSHPPEPTPAPPGGATRRALPQSRRTPHHTSSSLRSGKPPQRTAPAGAGEDPSPSTKPLFSGSDPPRRRRVAEGRPASRAAPQAGARRDLPSPPSLRGHVAQPGAASHRSRLHASRGKRPANPPPASHGTP